MIAQEAAAALELLPIVFVCGYPVQIAVIAFDPPAPSTKLSVRAIRMAKVLDERWGSRGGVLGRDKP